MKNLLVESMFQLECIDITAYPEILIEHTFKIKSDVDYIWENYMSKVLGEYKRNPSKFYDSIKSGQSIFLYKFNSNELPSKSCIKASFIKECEIFCGVDVEDCYYKYNAFKLILSLNVESVLSLKDAGINDNTIRTMPWATTSLFPENIKMSIAHELSHYLDNVINLGKNGLNAKLKSNQGKIPEDEFSMFSQHELDAYIHSIEQIKDSVSDAEYNSLTLYQLFNINKRFKNVIQTLYIDKSTEFRRSFLRKLYRRMYRENLLGKNMFPKLKPYQFKI